jgi:hypothetical protein
LDPQPPNPVKRSKTDIPTLLSADILALRLHAEIAIQMLRNVDVRSSLNGGHSPRQRLRQLCARSRHSVQTQFLSGPLIRSSMVNRP